MACTNIQLVPLSERVFVIPPVPKLKTGRQHSGTRAIIVQLPDSLFVAANTTTRVRSQKCSHLAQHDESFVDERARVNIDDNRCQHSLRPTIITSHARCFQSCPACLIVIYQRVVMDQNANAWAMVHTSFCGPTKSKYA
jgi:hypothetical protein